MLHKSIQGRVIQQVMLRSVEPSRIHYQRQFIHTLDTISKNRYLEMEMCRETTNWDAMTQRFKVTFTIEHEYPSIDAVLQAI
jgi:hypothetical protein